MTLDTAGAYTLTATATGASSATTTSINVTPPAVLQFDSAEFMANVTAGSANIQIDRSGNLGANVNVLLSSPGGSDVAAFSQMVSFGPNVTSETVAVPIINNGQSGESDVDIPLDLGFPSSGADFGAVSAGTLVIHDNNPPPLVTVSRVVDMTNKKHKVTEVDVYFSGPVNASEADTLATYRLATPGKKGSYTAKNAAVIKLKSARYTASSNEVVLIPKIAFALTKPVQVLVYGTGPNALEDSEGRVIDGDHNGTPGGNAIAIITKGGVTYDAAALARSAALTPARATAVVDALLARGDLNGLRDTVRVDRARHSAFAR